MTSPDFSAVLRSCSAGQYLRWSESGYSCFPPTQPFIERHYGVCLIGACALGVVLAVIIIKVLVWRAEGKSGA